jgi:hypothetical protein
MWTVIAPQRRLVMARVARFFLAIRISRQR